MNFLPFRDNVKFVIAHRNPTAYEIKFGEGAIHYKEFPVELWKHKNGKPKQWIKCPVDNLRYYR